MGTPGGTSGVDLENGLRGALLGSWVSHLVSPLLFQKPDPETMSAAPGATSTTKPLMAMSSDSLASVITTLLLTAETPTRNLLFT